MNPHEALDIPPRCPSAPSADLIHLDRFDDLKGKDPMRYEYRVAVAEQLLCPNEHPLPRDTPVEECPECLREEREARAVRKARLERQARRARQARRSQLPPAAG